MIEIGTKLRDFMVSVDWKQFALDIISVASGVASFVRALGGLKGVLDFAIIAWISIATVTLMLLAPALAGVAAHAFGLSVAAGPIALIYADIGGMASFAHAPVRTCSKVKPIYDYLLAAIGQTLC